MPKQPQSRLVQKFGGTSMGTPQSINEHVARIVKRAAANKKNPVVVVSAMSGVNTQLLKIATKAVTDKKIDKQGLEEIRNRHLAVFNGEAPTDVEEFIKGELDKVRNLLSAIVIIRELPIRSHDAIIAVGEKLSAYMLTSILSVQGSKAEYIDTEYLIPETLRYESDQYWDEIEQLFRARLEAVPVDVVPVVPGYFGALHGGILNAVGRGYSDYSASLIGSALKASEVEIWTDVDGVLSADPRVVKNATVLDRISYDEMAELSSFGAKVLHPFSVRPAVRSNVSMRILNTFNSDHPGTVVEVSHHSTTHAFKSIASKKDIGLIRITTPRMLMAHGFLAKVGAVLERHRTSIDLIATSEVSISFSIEGGASDRSVLLKELSALGDTTETNQLAIVSLVGIEISGRQDTLAKTFAALDAAEIDVRLVSFGDCKINLSIVVPGEQCDRAVAALHGVFFPA